MGFFSFVLRGAKKILISPPPLKKSFHDWKMKFFFICGEVIPMAMQFQGIVSIPKEEMRVPRGVAWYESLMALPNRVFGEQVLVAAGMSDKWLKHSESKPVLLLGGEGKLPSSIMFPKRVSKKKTATAKGAAVKKTEMVGATSDAASQKGTPQFRQSRLEDFVYVANSLEESYSLGGKSQGNMVTDLRGLGSAGSKGPNVEEPEAEPDAEELIKKNALKRSCAERRLKLLPLLKRLLLASLLGRKGA
ncbi:hypothetical protein HanOQP8_Chr02g0045181 [Helianthus annuus]|nr:hypothetical protein HanOQP8_Chr02g0045181 [Helianthus annuus]